MSVNPTFRSLSSDVALAVAKNESLAQGLLAPLTYDRAGQQLIANAEAKPKHVMLQRIAASIRNRTTALELYDGVGVLLQLRGGYGALDGWVRSGAPNVVAGILEIGAELSVEMPYEPARLQSANEVKAVLISLEQLEQTWNSLPASATTPVSSLALFYIGQVSAFYRCAVHRRESILLACV